MVGIESSMELSEAAKNVKKPEVAEAERERQKKFYEALRARKAEQPQGAFMTHQHTIKKTTMRSINRTQARHGRFESRRPELNRGDSNMTNTKYVYPAHIPIPPQYKKVLTRLWEYPYKRREIIPYVVVYSIFGSCLRFSKKSTVAVLAELEKQEVIEIVPYNGIRILKKNSDGMGTLYRRGKSGANF